MDFTGERAIEGNTPPGIMRAHLLRYQFAARYGAKQVLDIACGTGYGSHLLARTANRAAVLGVDIDEECIRYATCRYSMPGLRFEVGDLLSHAGDSQRFDLVVSFETIEHVTDPERGLIELRRCLRPDGLLIVSTPNRYLSSPGLKAGERPPNPFHTVEFSRQEFADLLVRCGFRIQGTFGQCNLPMKWVALRFASQLSRHFERMYLSPLAHVRPVSWYAEPLILIFVASLK